MNLVVNRQKLNSYLNKLDELTSQHVALESMKASGQETAFGSLAELDGRILASKDKILKCGDGLMRVNDQWRTEAAIYRPIYQRTARNVRDVLCGMLENLACEQLPAYTPRSDGVSQ